MTRLSYREWCGVTVLVAGAAALLFGAVITNLGMMVAGAVALGASAVLTDSMDL